MKTQPVVLPMQTRAVLVSVVPTRAMVPPTVIVAKVLAKQAMSVIKK